MQVGPQRRRLQVQHGVQHQLQGGGRRGVAAVGRWRVGGGWRLAGVGADGLHVRVRLAGGGMRPGAAVRGISSQTVRSPDLLWGRHVLPSHNQAGRQADRGAASAPGRDRDTSLPRRAPCGTAGSAAHLQDTTQRNMRGHPLQAKLDRPKRAWGNTWHVHKASL